MSDLRAEIQLLKAIVRKANAILSDDDSFEVVRGRYERLRDEYAEARAAYFERFGRSL